MNVRRRWELQRSHFIIIKISACRVRSGRGILFSVWRTPTMRDRVYKIGGQNVKMYERDSKIFVERDGIVKQFDNVRYAAIAVSDKVCDIIFYNIMLEAEQEYDDVWDKPRRKSDSA